MKAIVRILVFGLVFTALYFGGLSAGRFFSGLGAGASITDLADSRTASEAASRNFGLHYGPAIAASATAVSAVIAFGLNWPIIALSVIAAAGVFYVMNENATAPEESAAREAASTPVAARPSSGDTPGSPLLRGPAAQRRAVQRFPELAVLNSPLNREFVRRYNYYQRTDKLYFADPDWPLKLAEESFTALQLR